MKVELSEQEATILIQSLDVATKSGGLNAAQACLPIAMKLHQALDAEKNIKTVVEKTAAKQQQPKAPATAPRNG
jgi:hypothetical protein